MNKPIDIVIPWVDGSDPRWIAEKSEWYNKLNPDKSANTSTRFQDWDNLKFLFRAIEKFMPWVNRVFLVTWGHIPNFLNTDSARVKIIKHTDYIPAEYLPTFNSNTIEMNLHRIVELSENFILFNDDTFPLMEIDEGYYFNDNILCDEAIETPIIPVMFGEVAKYTWNMRALNISIINKHFAKRDVQKENYDKWFCAEYGELLKRNETLNHWDNFVGFRDPHVPTAFKKVSFEKVWNAEKKVLSGTCAAKFRDYSCVSQWLIRYWQLCEGNFIPRRTLGKSYTVTIGNYKEIAEVIRGQGQQMICLNENCTPEEFEIIKAEINAAFEEILPDKSSFEK